MCIKIYCPWTVIETFVNFPRFIIQAMPGTSKTRGSLGCFMRLNSAAWLQECPTQNVLILVNYEYMSDGHVCGALLNVN
jgi:hypothetical protein